tara:strand:+ start:1982 stop:2257 length:276 start_codon:yes stop_codon:yes gene_type:complete
MATKICYPTNETWFVCWNDERTSVTAYGSVLHTQCMESKWTEVDYYHTEEEWSECLSNNGIILEQADDVTDLELKYFEELGLENLIPDVEF